MNAGAQAAGKNEEDLLNARIRVVGLNPYGAAQDLKRKLIMARKAAQKERRELHPRKEVLVEGVIQEEVVQVVKGFSQA